MAHIQLPLVWASLLLGATVAAGQPQPVASPGNPAAADPRKLPPSYLSREALPDSLALLPPPPATGSAAMQRDEEARRSVQGMKGTARYTLAAADAVIGFPEIPNDFSCATGFPIRKETTPRLYALMGKMLIDVGLSTYRAKDQYKRTRPFVVHRASTCYPKDEELLRSDGSYPSGHSAIGWGLALVLAELNPGRANEILQRGREFGQSRLVCDAHWQSDIDAGRLVAAATVARLHADQKFRSDLEAARHEAAAAAENGNSSTEQCVAETRALAATSR